MKIVITGGAGFIGIMLARRLLREAEIAGPDGKPAKIDEVELFDMTVPAERPAGLDDRVRFTAGEITDKAAIQRLVNRKDIGIFHLASVVSGGGELDFDLA